MQYGRKVRLGKSSRWFAFILVSVMIMLISQPSHAYTTEAVLPTSGTKVVGLYVYPGNNNVLIMDSPSSGNWTFKSYGMWGLALDCWPDDLMDPPPVYVDTYWKDNSDPYGGWNQWLGGGPVCYPTSFWWTNLYSGSSNISYKFVYRNEEVVTYYIYAKFVTN